MNVSNPSRGNGVAQLHTTKRKPLFMLVSNPSRGNGVAQLVTAYRRLCYRRGRFKPLSGKWGCATYEVVDDNDEIVSVSNPSRGNGVAQHTDKALEVLLLGGVSNPSRGNGVAQPRTSRGAREIRFTVSNPSRGNGVAQPLCIFHPNLPGVLPDKFRMMKIGSDV